MRHLVLALLLAVVPALVGCGEDAAGGAGSGGISSGGGSGGWSGGAPIVYDAMPALAALQPDKWNQLSPGGDTLCARGSPYSFFVYPGAADKVAVHFMGGGACWDTDTCRTDFLFSSTVEGNVDFTRSDAGGILDMPNADNPLHGWTHVLVSYCTGDIHWGDRDTTYGAGADAYVIHHRGAANARSALAWIYDNFTAPTRAAVTGCSAGAYGSILWSAHVQQHYPSVDVVQLADSGTGVITPEFRSTNFPHWDPANAFPSFVPELDPSKVDVTTKELPDMYIAIGKHFPRMQLAQFNYLNDTTQTGFYAVMGGKLDDWSGLMLDHVAQIHAGIPNFSSYTADGTEHCILPFKRFYDATTTEPTPSAWTTKLIDGEDPGDVACAECTR
jgi:hypothetical protein